jgi:hypothetical protein
LTQFLAVGAAGAAYTSLDGLTWTSQTTGVNVPLYGLLGSAVMYVAVGASGMGIAAGRVLNVARGVRADGVLQAV